MDALIADLKRERPSDFMRFTVDAGATGDAHAGGIGGGDMARAALDITRSGR